jgi:hypothetical protein
MIYKSLHNKLRSVQHEPLLKYGDKIEWDERVSKYASTNDTVVVTFTSFTSVAQSYFVCISSHNRRITEYLSKRFCNGIIQKI